MVDPSSERTVKSALILTYAGTLPLIAAALNALLMSGGLQARLVSGVYGAVIVSFLAGVQWGTYLAKGASARLNLLIVSNIFALAAWASLLLFGDKKLLVCEAAMFPLLLLVDLHSTRKDLVPVWFFTLRRNATVIVETCLIALIAAR